MTVKHLIRLLNQMDEDAEVVLAANYGDRSGTMQALDIEGVEECDLAETAYSSSGWKVLPADPFSRDERGARTAVVIS